MYILAHLPIVEGSRDLYLDVGKNIKWNGRNINKRELNRKNQVLSLGVRRDIKK